MSQTDTHHLNDLELHHQTPLDHFKEFIASRRMALIDSGTPDALACFEEAAALVEKQLIHHLQTQD